MTAQREVARGRHGAVASSQDRDPHVTPPVPYLLPPSGVRTRFIGSLPELRQLSLTRVGGIFTDGMAAVKREAARRADEGLGALVELGLTLNEARAYAALLERGASTAAEVVRAAGVPRQKVYEALRALEERGFLLRAAATGVTVHTAVNPGEALPAWMRQREHERRLEAERDELLAERLARALPRPQRAHRTQASHEELQAIVGRARTSETLERLVGQATQTLHMLQQPPFLQARSRWNQAEAAAARRGVEVRVLYTEEAVLDERRWRTLVDAGGDVRVSDAVPMKLLVRDGVEAMISLRDPATGEQGLTSAVIRHPDLVGPLQLLFDREWKQGRRLATAPPGRSRGRR